MWMLESMNCEVAGKIKDSVVSTICKTTSCLPQAPVDSERIYGSKTQDSSMQMYQKNMEEMNRYTIGMPENGSNVWYHYWQTL